jgi:hypothetical protein
MWLQSQPLLGTTLQKQQKAGLELKPKDSYYHTSDEGDKKE